MRAKDDRIDFVPKAQKSLGWQISDLDEKIRGIEMKYGGSNSKLPGLRKKLKALRTEYHAQAHKATDIALIPEADGAQLIKPTDGARQAFKGWASGKQHVGDSKRKVVCPTCKKQLTPTEGRTVPFHVGKNMKACRGSNSVGAEWADPYAPAKDSKCWMCGGSMSGAGKYDDVCPDCMHPRAKKSINLPPAEAAKVRTANKALRRAKDAVTTEEIAERYAELKKTTPVNEIVALLIKEFGWRAKQWATTGKAQDGILSSPFMALAALLAILNHFNKETVGPQDYDLTTYRPKKKEW